MYNNATYNLYNKLTIERSDKVQKEGGGKSIDSFLLTSKFNLQEAIE